jgi:hypothetical protein
MHFDREATSLDAGQNEACLAGVTLQGVRFQGCDSVTALGPGVVLAGAGRGIFPALLFLAPLLAAPLAALRRLTASR